MKCRSAAVPPGNDAQGGEGLDSVLGLGTRGVDDGDARVDGKIWGKEGRELLRVLAFGSSRWAVREHAGERLPTERGRAAAWVRVPPPEATTDGQKREAARSGQWHLGGASGQRKPCGVGWGIGRVTAARRCEKKSRRDADTCRLLWMYLVSVHREGRDEAVPGGGATSVRTSRPARSTSVRTAETPLLLPCAAVAVPIIEISPPEKSTLLTT